MNKNKIVKKKILFICKHNIFRSQVAENLFNRLNKNKKYISDSAGLIKWNKKNLVGDVAYKIEKKVSKEKGIKLKKDFKGLNSSLLKSTDILVIVADDVPVSIFKKDKSFNGKILVWKTKDVKDSYKGKEKVALRSIEFIEKKVRELVKKLK